MDVHLFDVESVVIGEARENSHLGTCRIIRIETKEGRVELNLYGEKALCTQPALVHSTDSVEIAETARNRAKALQLVPPKDAA